MHNHSHNQVQHAHTHKNIVHVAGINTEISHLSFASPSEPTPEINRMFMHMYHILSKISSRHGPDWEETYFWTMHLEYKHPPPPRATYNRQRKYTQTSFVSSFCYISWPKHRNEELQTFVDGSIESGNGSGYQPWLRSWTVRCVTAAIDFSVGGSKQEQTT